MGIEVQRVLWPATDRPSLDQFWNRLAMRFARRSFVENPMKLCSIMPCATSTFCYTETYAFFIAQSACLCSAKVLNGILMASRLDSDSRSTLTALFFSHLKNLSPLTIFVDFDQTRVGN